MAMATVVTLLAASGGSNGSNNGDGTTTDVPNAILPCYTDIVDVRSDNDGNRAPAIDGGNIDGGGADFNNGMQRVCGGHQRWQGEGGNTSGGGGGSGGSRKRKHRKANGGRGN
jgi:hypothetical protein